MGKFTIGIAGNPNCGKTTMFNALTGARQHVANWPGVTVEKKIGNLKAGNDSIEIVDLPGTYSLTAYTQEELVARNFLVDERPEVVIDVMNADALERNLYLAVQIMELGVPLVLGLNMMDEVRSSGKNIDSEKLAGNSGIGHAAFDDDIFIALKVFDAGPAGRDFVGQEVFRCDECFHLVEDRVQIGAV